MAGNMFGKKLFLTAESLLNVMIASATGGQALESDYSDLRAQILASGLSDFIPRTVHTCRSLNQLWGVVRHKFPTYQGRRDFLYKEFQPLLDHLEQQNTTPADSLINDSVKKLDGAYVHEAWRKALERRNNDPEGAITMSKSLLEAICKHILDVEGVAYGNSPDLNKLYSLTAEQLNLSPSQHSDKDFRRILGGCTSVVEGLGGLRNRLGDSHGKGQQWFKPASRHAELSVNLAGAMATFLMSTWEFRRKSEIKIKNINVLSCTLQ